ncbi:hypothetical protein BJF79_39030 [Actinomadura sp. CNU-125]|uniref:hypothetical protein n=1 Tax=Actinomadura sp. CNU-125 TaxID=1904961 RepID=UPI0009619F84|nr:hypothetical protein [Actinomadura sp. CNU-125]OLT30419.1 hypothetical protein BJF79_39030 [Actinomadura sp. CNU-125]
MTRLPHDTDHDRPSARTPGRITRVARSFCDRGIDVGTSDRRKPGRFDPRRPAPRIVALATGTMLAATAFLVTASTAAMASTAPAPAGATVPDGATMSDGPPVPSDAAPLPMGRPPAPILSGTHAAPSVLKPAVETAPKDTAQENSTQKDAAQKDTAQEATVQKAASTAAKPDEPNLPRQAKAERLDHGFVTDVLRSRDIEWRSTGNCSDREKPTCTSFTGLRWETLEGLLRFAAKSDCKIVVTGGTERGHAPGRHSHYNGYKIDIATGACVDREIEGYDRKGVRSDGAKLYRSPEGGLYARESDHWDITYT